jgi:hypothetical protein
MLAYGVGKIRAVDGYRLLSVCMLHVVWRTVLERGTYCYTRSYELLLLRYTECV